MLWVGVHCTLEVGETRERARGDRVTGMHRQQAQLVHQGVQYDLNVDTSQGTPQEISRQITKQLACAP